MALAIFHLQYHLNPIYQKYVDNLKILPEKIKEINQIPFLPISFFKTHTITSTQFTPEIVFESSGTTQQNTSRHLVKKISVYQNSFLKGFHLFYGDIKEWCIIGLLPGYLERGNSSLIFMVNDLIERSEHPNSGFYLHNQEDLFTTLQKNELSGQGTLLIGVTYALLDFAEKYPSKLKHTTIMETGGMKGRREEITRDEVHQFLENNLGVKKVHSEYGMTELLSQGYSSGIGIFNNPPWLKIGLREYNDPFAITFQTDKKSSNGLINVIDLANLYSCGFIATDDVGKLYPDGSFEVLGRRDASDLRGCSLLTTE
jgi:hypothetical protein